MLSARQADALVVQAMSKAQNALDIQGLTERMQIVREQAMQMITALRKANKQINDIIKKRKAEIRKIMQEKKSKDEAAAKARQEQEQAEFAPFLQHEHMTRRMTSKLTGSHNTMQVLAADKLQQAADVGDDSILLVTSIVPADAASVSAGQQLCDVFTSFGKEFVKFLRGQERRPMPKPDAYKPRRSEQSETHFHGCAAGA